MTNKLQELYETHVLMGMRKQRHFATLLGEHRWEYDKASGTMSFAPGPTYHVQVLGTESAASDTWLWAWANPDSHFPAEQLVAAERLRSLGQEWGVSEWTTPELPREQLPAHLLAPVALGVLQLPAYYRGGMENSNLVCLISDPKFGPIPGLGGTEFVSTLSDAISNCEIPNHRQAVQEFLEQLGWKPKWDGSSLDVLADDGVRVWVNGELRWSNALHRPLPADEDQFDVALRSGWNRMLVKVRNDDGGYGVMLRIADPDAALRFAAEPR